MVRSGWRRNALQLNLSASKDAEHVHRQREHCVHTYLQLSPTRNFTTVLTEEGTDSRNVPARHGNV
jgi:hypothetical protein